MLAFTLHRDKSPKKIKQLEANIDRYGLRLKELALDIRALDFEKHSKSAQ